jgi:hypothetical protein
MQAQSDGKACKVLTSAVQPPAKRPSPTILITRDPDIRSVLMRELNRHFPDPAHDLILEEFGCKGARIDVAVVNGFMHGFEIKSDSDSLARLDGQVEQYSRIFDFMTLICGRKLVSAASDAIPKWWGLQLARMEDGEVKLEEIWKPKQNPSQDKMALVRMLWKDEALQCLRRNEIKGVTSKHSAEEVWNHAAEKLELRTIVNEVRLAIKARGGSGFEKQSTQDDDSCTIQSIALEQHFSSNLAWLLSQRFHDLPD